MSHLSWRMQALLAEHNWEAMSLYELQCLQGRVEIAHDPGYIQACTKKHQKRKQQKYMEEKPFQFNILEYLEQTKKIEITEVFLREFYRLSPEDQAKAMEVLARNHRLGISSRMGEDYTLQELLRMKRIDAFYDQWIEEQTKGWVTRELRKIPEDIRRK